MSGKEVETINLEDYFTTDHEKEGVWFEPNIKGKPCGIQFLVTGTDTDENIVNAERFQKAIDELDDIKDNIEAANKRKVLEANRVADFVKGIRSAEGAKVLFGGKPLEYSKPMIQELCLKSPLIQNEILKFAVKTENFIRRKKDD